MRNQLNEEVESQKQLDIALDRGDMYALNEEALQKFEMKNQLFKVDLSKIHPVKTSNGTIEG